jgi:hypothetical protein
VIDAAVAPLPSAIATATHSIAFDRSHRATSPLSITRNGCAHRSIAAHRADAHALHASPIGPSSEICTFAGFAADALGAALFEALGVFGTLAIDELDGAPEMAFFGATDAAEEAFVLAETDVPPGEGAGERSQPSVTTAAIPIRARVRTIRVIASASYCPPQLVSVFLIAVAPFSSASAAVSSLSVVISVTVTLSGR